MPTIKAFRPLYPSQHYADQFLFENPVLAGHANAVSAKPLKNNLELKSGHADYAQSNMEIASNLSEFISKKILVRDKEPGIYVYEIRHNGVSQTGIWALTSINDYKNGHIKKHELTRLEEVQKLKASREETLLEGTPVLITYAANPLINDIISKITAHSPDIAIENEISHRIWKINDAGIMQQLIQLFGTVKTCYLADGHHRTAAALQMAADKGLTDDPTHPAAYFNSLYVATDQLKINEYYRLVAPKCKLDDSVILKNIEQHFNIALSNNNNPVQPESEHHIGMNLAGQWYHLHPKAHTHDPSVIINNLDVMILQKNILEPIFNIINVQTDPQISFIGGNNAIEVLLEKLAADGDQKGFTLPPIRIQQLIAVADSGAFMPPKSTWIDPKVPFGLLMALLK